MSNPAAPPRDRNGTAGNRRWAKLAHEVVVRLLDVSVASVLLVLSAPLMALIALRIRLDSPGPALFRQQRVGVNRRRNRAAAYSGHERRQASGHGKPYLLCKFRSMYADAISRFPELYTYRYTAEELHTLPIKLLVGTKRNPADVEGSIEQGDDGSLDPRITPVGRWLRRTSLDELPNLWNVLKGDMHLVGPRPDIEENIAYYTPRELHKLEVKPGVTGLAQVRGRGNLSFQQTNDYDIEYAENRCLSLDLRILCETVWALIRRDGAY